MTGSASVSDATRDALSCANVVEPGAEVGARTNGRALLAAPGIADRVEHVYGMAVQVLDERQPHQRRRAGTRQHHERVARAGERVRPRRAEARRHVVRLDRSSERVQLLVAQCVVQRQVLALGRGGHPPAETSCVRTVLRHRNPHSL
jgi:hypothetical protein